MSVDQTSLLQGKTIKSVHVSRGEEVLRFDLTDGNSVYWTADNIDWCSNCWFADITGFNALVGGTVASVKEIEGHTLADPMTNRSRQDIDKVYGHTVTTDKGRASIILRNSSNGFYCGCRYECSKCYNNYEWREITDDWSA